MKINKVIEAIQNVEDIALITHINPDGDALGSSLALMEALEIIGKTVNIYCQDPVPKGLRFLDNIHRIKPPSQTPQIYSMAIALDCSDIARMGSCSSIWNQAEHKVNIDHHKSNDLYGDINVVDGQAAATGELVFELISRAQITFKKSMAKSLYTAIVSDTGGFSFSNTSPTTHRIAARLIDSGADIDNIHKHLFKALSIGWVRLLGLAINTLQFSHEGQVATMEITQEMFEVSGASKDQTEGIIRYAMDVNGVELAALFRQVDTKEIKVSLRSGSIIDVSALAETFGGGGHIRAAGYTSISTMQEAKGEFRQAIDNLYKEL